jgi:hypothetical protein
MGHEKKLSLHQELKDLKAIFKYCLLLSFLMATLFHNIRFTYLVSFYTLNNESFTELFCENIDKPKLECNGQCTLTAASEDLNKENNELTLNSFQQEITYYVTSFNFTADLPVQTGYESNYSYLNKYAFLFTSIITHPPIGIS